jgi:serine/threonine-protein kinase
MYDPIGAGGMATVHLGLPLSNDRLVAIKRLRPHFAAEPEVARSFLDEARLSARVRHPNVVATLDVVTQGGEAFLVMEYVEGVSLASLMRGQPEGTECRTPEGSGLKRTECRTPEGRGLKRTAPRAVPAEIAAAILVAVLSGLHAAHEAVGPSGEPLNVVHRDVSPQNILVGVDGTARVLDFGIAKSLGRQQTTREGKIKGKLGYMAPEQLSGRGVTRRTDLFASAIVFWELLAGCRLFRADDEAATVTRVLLEPVRPPSAVCPTAPRSLDAVVLRALERDPSKRYLTAEAMARAIEAAIVPASPEAVSQWVHATAADEIAVRASHVRDVHAHARSGEWPPARAGDIPAAEPDRLTTPSASVRAVSDRGRARHRWRTSVGVAAIAGLLVAAGVWSSMGRRNHATPPAESAASSATAAVPSSVSAPSEERAPPQTAPAPATLPPFASAAKSSIHRAPKAPLVGRPSATGRERLYSRD